MDRGDLVSDDIVVSIIAERLEQARRQARASSSTAFRATGPGGSARPDARRPRGSKLDARHRDEGRRRGAGRAHRRPLHLRQMRQGLSRQLREAEKAGVCDVCGSTEFVRRADDNEKTVQGAGLQIYNKQTAPLVALLRPDGHAATVDGMAESATVTRQIEDVLERS